MPASVFFSRWLGLANAVFGNRSAGWRITWFSFVNRCCSAALLTFHFVRQFLVGLCCAAPCRYARSQSGYRECGAPNPSFKRTSLTGRRLTQTLGVMEVMVANAYVAIAFLVLAAFKWFDAFFESAELSWTAAIMATFYMAIFGSPQLYWASKCAQQFKSDFQRYVAVAVAVSFLLLSGTFGSFPGAPSPSWGGPSHFEVPIALVVEWGVALVGVLLFVKTANMNMPK